MSAITLGEARSQLAAWLAASKKTAAGQSYSIGNRALTRANAGEIREQIEYWTGKVERLEAGGSSSGARVQRVVPRDI